MASDRQQFERALQKWDSLKQEGHYSVPEAAGMLAIAVSFQLAEERIDETEQQEFCSEAQLIATNVRRYSDKNVILAINASAFDLQTLIKDPHISDIITIGHGALPYLYTSNTLDPAKTGNRFDWRDVSASTDHLKTGWFTQRHCGNAARHLSVPLGSLAMVGHNRVLASANQSFNPRNPLLDEENAKIAPIHISSRLSYDEVKEKFSYDDFCQPRS